MFNLSGKTALVTGATGGIGSEISRALHGAGASVVLTGRRQEALDTLKADLKKRVYAFTADMSIREDVLAMMEEAEILAGPIDIVVCNAGITRDNLALRMKEEEWEQVLDVNLTSTFLLNRASIKKMMKRKYGRVINITSLVGTIGNPGQANYAASKAGIVGATKSLAQEVATRGITLNCIAPGFIHSAMTDVLNETHVEKMMQQIPMGRFGEAREVAAAAVFLASDEASYITGQTVHVNGGMVMI